MLASALLLALPLVLVTGLSQADASDAVAIETEVDRLMAPLVDLDLVSGSVLIARHGNVLLAKG